MFLSKPAPEDCDSPTVEPLRIFKPQSPQPAKDGRSSAFRYPAPPSSTSPVSKHSFPLPPGASSSAAPLPFPDDDDKPAHQERNLVSLSEEELLQNLSALPQVLTPTPIFFSVLWPIATALAPLTTIIPAIKKRTIRRLVLRLAHQAMRRPNLPPSNNSR
ncbi:hypothetical protein LB505_012486 [Fusarium chuoi]|nr:hypothetical protein LB505_012486 [Fusarium chuoi]